MIYNPATWYWSVAGSTTQVWSSAQAQYVPVTDATYLAWLAAGGVTTNIASEAQLQSFFAAQYPAGWPPTLAQQAIAALSAGLAITSTSTPALNGTYAIDPASQADIIAVQTSINAGLGLPLGASSVQWADLSGALHSFSAAQFTALAGAVRDYVYALKIVAMSGTGTLPTPAATIP